MLLCEDGNYRESRWFSPWTKVSGDFQVAKLIVCYFELKRFETKVEISIHMLSGFEELYLDLGELNCICNCSQRNDRLKNTIYLG